MCETGAVNPLTVLIFEKEQLGRRKRCPAFPSAGCVGGRGLASGVVTTLRRTTRATSASTRDGCGSGDETRSPRRNSRTTGFSVTGTSGTRPSPISPSVTGSVGERFTRRSFSTVLRGPATEGGTPPTVPATRHGIFITPSCSMGFCSSPSRTVLTATAWWCRLGIGGGRRAWSTSCPFTW